jgi:hypothetical protein
MIDDSPQQGFQKMDFCRKYQRPIAVSLCVGIAADVVAYGVTDYSCWSPPRATSACAISEAVLPHTEYPDVPLNLAMDNISVIASTGTMYHPLYLFPQLPGSTST